MTHPATAGTGGDLGVIPVLVVANGGRRRLASLSRLGHRLLFCHSVADLKRRLDEGRVTAVLIETRDAEGTPVPAAIKEWVRGNPRVPILVWTGGSASALSEILDLSAAGADVRLVLRPRDDPGAALEGLLADVSGTHPGAIPALLRGVVLGAPSLIQPELTLAVYHAWPDPKVGAWAGALGLTRQALNRRLRTLHYANASVVLDYFSGSEIAIRLTTGTRLKDVAAMMGRPDERSLRRRLALLGTRPEELRDEADFRALIPRIATDIRLRN